MWKISSFTIFENTSAGVLAKNTFTESVILLGYEAKNSIDHWLLNQHRNDVPDGIDDLIQHGFLVDENIDEFVEWREYLLTTRNDEAHIFTLHFEPTLRCQFECPYCFENGIDRDRPMKSETLNRSLEWFREYLRVNSEVDSLRLKFFGGEPLLCKKIVAESLRAYQTICRERDLCGLTDHITMNQMGSVCCRKIARNPFL